MDNDFKQIKGDGLMLNRWTGVGMVGKDGIDLRYSPNGKPVANFKIGCKRNFKTNDKYEWDNLSIVYWGQGAEYLARNAEEKTMVSVDGRIQSRSYQTNDGQTRWVTEIIADNVTVVSPKGGVTPEQMGSEVDFSDDEIPF